MVKQITACAATGLFLVAAACQGWMPLLFLTVGIAGYGLLGRHVAQPQGGH